jgi:hypothetical protein
MFPQASRTARLTVVSRRIGQGGARFAQLSMRDVDVS